MKCHSSELILQKLQIFVKHSNQIKQIHALLITNNFLFFTPNISSSTPKYISTLLHNALIRAYLNINQPYKTLLIFTHMLAHYQSPPNSHTFPSLIKAAASLPSLNLVLPTSLHAHVIKRGVATDPFIRTLFLVVYWQCWDVRFARNMFDEMPEPCVVSFNAMIDGYSKNGDMGSAVGMFERIVEKDIVSWTSVISGYGRNECFREAVEWFGEMMGKRGCFVRPNEATFVNVLASCANLHGGGGLLQGKQIHGYMIKNEVRFTVFMGTGLVSLYGKLGCLEYAIRVFNVMVVKKTCTWNALISSMALNGMEKEALDMYQQMKNVGLKPNEVTFVALLTACSCAKLVELGLELFQTMLQVFGVVPQMEHYGCMVDLLGRAGFLSEAYEFMRKMPFEPDASVYGALLGACKLHGAIELGNAVAKRLLELQPRHCGRYVILSSIYAEAESWDNAATLRKAMIDAGIDKIPAYSMIDSV